MSVATLVEPACLWVPPGRVGDFGDAVATIADLIGRPPEPEQRLAMGALTAYDRRGRFLSLEAGIEMPRQNGKTKAVMLPLILWSALTDPDLYTWTSHLADTHLASFRDLAGSGPRDDTGLIASCAWLSARVKSVSWENGAEGIVWTNGAELEFRCRSSRRGRGRSGNTVFNDEALILAAEAMGAVLPTLATRSLHGNARAYYASSAAKASSGFLRSLRRRALAADRTITWVGWWARGSWAEPGCESDECSHLYGTAGCALDDEALYASANILLGRRTSVEFLRTMRRTLSPLEFGREFLGWQESGDDAVSVDVLSKLADPGSTPLAKPCALAVDVSPRQRSAAVCMVGKRPDGLLHVELLAHEQGTAWLGEFLRDRCRRLGVRRVWRLGGRAPIEAVAADIDGVRWEVMPETDFVAGCQGFDRLVSEGGLRHLGEARLVAAFGAAVRRDVADGAWVLSRKGSSGDISPAIAAVVAARALPSEASRSILF